jgi:alkanesulfonate monooxygenase SsuD/methylene tetrahydromethanopterin reductase-like flavin-dependent oxidoreductase (luciferase family)
VADDLGPDRFSTTEHHLYTEGGEALRNNGLMFANHAAHTKNIQLIPMAIAPTATNPIRAAEDMAVLQSTTNFEAFAAPFAPVPQRTQAW